MEVVGPVLVEEGHRGGKSSPSWRRSAHRGGRSSPSLGR